MKKTLLLVAVTIVVLIGVFYLGVLVTAYF